MSVPFGRRGALFAGVVAAAAVATLLASVPAAQAATLPIGSYPSTFMLSAPTMTHSAQALEAQWSVFAADNRVSLRVRDAGGVIGQSGPSDLHTGRWVAIDQNAGRRAPGRYLVDVTSRLGGSGGPYRAQFRDGGPRLTSGGTTEIGYVDGQWIVDLRQVYLRRGDTLRFTVRGSAVSAVNVLHSDPARPSTWVQNDGMAGQTFWLNKPESTDVNGFAYVAPATGTYALVFERGWWDPTATVTSTIVPFWGDFERKPIELPLPGA